LALKVHSAAVFSSRAEFQTFDLSAVWSRS
jgi:hypothetical protein